jgi:preprotein translocase subunit SecE
LLVAALGAWGAFRAVNYPRFADFLISVQAEVDKVSWASKEELYRATVVVVVTMFLLGFTLLAFDVIWQWFFRLIGVLQF